MSVKKYISNALSYVFLAIGAFLCYRFFTTVNITEVYSYFQKGRTWPIVCVGIVSILVYIFRSLRWNLLLAAAHEKNTSIYTSFSSLSMGYLLSFFIPRAGEVFRCVLLKKFKDVSVPVSIGTVIIERVADVLMLLLILCASVLIVNETLYTFLYEFVYTPVAGAISQMSVYKLLILLVLMVVLAWIFIKYIYPHIHQKFKNVLLSTKEGLVSITHLKQPFLFVIYTLCIWVGYFLMTWLWFYMFDHTQEASLVQVFFIFVIGTIGRSIPIHGGGAGAYHFLVLQAFILCGFTESIGQSMAVIIHGGQTIFTLLAAILSLPVFVLKKV